MISPKWFALQRMPWAGITLLSTLAACGGGAGGSGGSTSTSSASSSSSSSSSTSSGSTSSSSGGGAGGQAPEGPTVVAELPVGSKAYGLALDEANVYWTELGTGEVRQARKDGTGRVTLASGQDAPHAVAVTDGFVFWGLYSATGSLRKAPIGGGATVDLLPFAPAVLEIVVDSTHLWWTREPDDVQRMPTAGLPDGGLEDLLTGNPLANGITLDATHIYWVNQQDGYVKKALRDLTADTPLATGDVPWGIAVDATSVYWTEVGSAPGAGKVMKASKLDGSGLTTLADMQGAPQGIAVDASHVYWANRDAGTVQKVPIEGGAATVIAAGQPKPVKLAIDESHVFWVNTEGDVIMKAPK